MARTATRKLAFTLLFQADFGQSISYPEATAQYGHQVDLDFLRLLVDGVLDRRGFLDQVISEFTRGWTAERLSRIDRAILRLATWELIGTDTPPAVVINEAVELAKNYSNQESPAFINGILDSIKAQREALSARLEE